jgi:hypothetical protein
VAAPIPKETIIVNTSLSATEEQAELRTAGFPWLDSTSGKIYLGLAALMIVLTALQAYLPLHINQGQRASWLSVVLVAVAGWVGLILGPKAGFPPMTSSHISNWRRLWLPGLVGLGAGLVMVVFDLLHPLGSAAQTQFPDSLAIYALGGLIEEIIIHLFATTLLIWLISGLILRGRYQEPMFWAVAVGGGLLYWLLQVNSIRSFFPELFSAALALQISLVIVVTITAGAYIYRKGGFLAALSLRYGFYLVWHIVWAGGIGLVRYFM